MPKGIYKRTEPSSKKGKPISEQHRQRIKDNHPNFSGDNHPQYGTHQSEESKRKKSEAMVGRKFSNEHRKHLSENHADFTGENGPNWRGGITPLNKKVRNSDKFINWRKDIFQRDGFVCCDCNKEKCYFHAHHIKPLSKILKEYNITTLEQAYNCSELWNLDNGKTLCEECHGKYRKMEE